MVRSILAGFALLGVAGADSYKCPASKAWVHAWSEQTTKIDKSCSAIQQEITDRINGKNGWYDPHNKGTYSITNTGGNELGLQRKTGNGKYTDEIILQFQDLQPGENCIVRGCSQSQVTSVLDFSTNFCNIRMLTCGTKDGCKNAGLDWTSTITDDTQSAGSTKEMSDCLKVMENEVRDYSGYTFQAFAKEFGKTYKEEEHQNRLPIFESNLAKVIAHNEEYKNGKHTWWAAVNELTDWTPKEFNRLRSKKYAPSTHPEVKLTASAPNPASVDWRTKGAVTKVKNQGGCGSCWAFSATESMESHYQIASGKLLELAPQTYVNCVKNPQGCGGTGGCEGATMELAFNMSVQTGIALEADLPYAGRDEKCSAYKAAVKCTGYVKNPPNDAAALETALATKGPISITVAAGSWQMYGGGLFHGCSKGFLGHQDNTLDHGVQLVGYTADSWIVRNSWGAGWGEKGFIRLQRATDNQTFTDKAPADGVACKPVPKSQTVGGECGILFDTSYPTGVTASDFSVVV